MKVLPEPHRAYSPTQIGGSARLSIVASACARGCGRRVVCSGRRVVYGGERKGVERVHQGVEKEWQVRLGYQSATGSVSEGLEGVAAGRQGEKRQRTR